MPTVRSMIGPLEKISDVPIEPLQAEIRNYYPIWTCKGGFQLAWDMGTTRDPQTTNHHLRADLMNKCNSLIKKGSCSRKVNVIAHQLKELIHSYILAGHFDPGTLKGRERPVHEHHASRISVENWYTSAIPP